MAVVFLHGFKGSGKNYIANVLGEMYPDHQQTAFAEPIRHFIMDVFQLNTIEEYDDFKRTTHFIKNRFVHGRDIVRKIGMKMRSYDDTQFNRYVSEIVRINELENRHTFVTDLRFDNEYQLSQDMKAEGLNVVTIKILSEHSGDGHESEVELDDDKFDFIINNTMNSKCRHSMKECLQDIFKDLI